jgi:uncharacterized protein (TIRG00374 family)
MKYLRISLKLSISIGLLGYLVYLADPVKILEVLNGIWSEGGIIYLVAAAVLFLLSLVIQSIRWKILVKGYGYPIPTRLLFKYYLIGLFFNNFLPTGIGGDVLRIYNLIHESGNRTISFASVLTERILGVTSILILTIISLLIMQDSLKNDILIFIALGMLASVLLLFFIAFSKRMKTPIESICRKLTFIRAGERIQKFLEAIRFYSDSKLIFIRILLLSMVSQMFLITMTYLLTIALGINVDYSYMFIVVPITFLLSMLPSINGIGFRDGGYVVFLARIGISKAAALSLSFLTLLIPMIISISGGILFMLQKKITREEEIKIAEKGI